MRRFALIPIAALGAIAALAGCKPGTGAPAERERGSFVWGEIRDAAGRADPVRVDLVQMLPGGTMLRRRCASGDEGVFYLADAAPGTYMLHSMVVRAGLRRTRIQVFSEPGEQNHTAFVIADPGIYFAGSFRLAGRGGAAAGPAHGVVRTPDSRGAAALARLLRKRPAGRGRPLARWRPRLEGYLLEVERTPVPDAR